ISGPFQADASEERSLRRQFAYDNQGIYHLIPLLISGYRKAICEYFYYNFYYLL
ncbi:hypothetical protein DPMN_129452, partial [Dreissena polymorpha]